MNAAAFASKHDIGATSQDVTRIRRGLARFYASVEALEPVSDAYIQLHAGEAILRAFLKHNPLSGQGHGVAIALSEIPQAWPPKYRASVAYHLGPLLEEVINS
ncbi:hypothetical protein HFO09_07640 [Rhizobium laguerreae]|uniref:hypothetical protein n=1 Tax=Rhizobium laguerreae TaxID=1076926 RepID=UPI001C90FDD4|nr:hypothetical protein [Rhizobium laguerreae]MBY3255564.1 hypothetical protein [Rhizobium laguerreae]MBY3282603.1 hypothetical protein [Rhizobium laguerreae]MBY3288957.1 hypothetical protein [Rhizobium laguerreae]